MAIVEALILSAAGTFIANYVQNKSREQQQVEKLFHTISDDLDKRLYSMRKFYWSKKNKDSKELQDTAWNEYRKVVDDLNMTLNSRFSSVETFFGNDISRKFHNINDEFIELSRTLWKIHNSDSYDEKEGMRFKEGALKLENLKCRLVSDMLQSSQPLYIKLRRGWRSKNDQQKTLSNPDAIRDNNGEDFLR